jgi:hypothetical protein
VFSPLGQTLVSPQGGFKDGGGRANPGTVWIRFRQEAYLDG